MPSKLRSETARRNGAKSRGPKTPEGKRASSRNALSHGLLSRSVVLPDESSEDFEQLVRNFQDNFSPVDDPQLGLIREMAASYWRLRRTWTIESGLFAQLRENAVDPRANLPSSPDAIRSSDFPPELLLINRYECRHHVAFHRALRNLVDLRTRGIPNEPKLPPDGGILPTLQPTIGRDNPLCPSQPLGAEVVESKPAPTQAHTPASSIGTPTEYQTNPSDAPPCPTRPPGTGVLESAPPPPPASPVCARAEYQTNPSHPPASPPQPDTHPSSSESPVPPVASPLPTSAPPSAAFARGKGL